MVTTASDLTNPTAVVVPYRPTAALRHVARGARHDREVARTLQHAMLTRLPDTDGLTMAARSLPANGQHHAGGDWYDAVTLADGSTSLVIGDVMGHDIAAAAAMGQVRSMLRMLICDRHEAPSSLVGRLDRALLAVGVNTMATLVLARVDPPISAEPGGGRVVRWTNAGHPTPLLVHADGRVVALDDTTDVLLGVRPETVRRDHACVVPPGATLLFCTDGLIETRLESDDVGRRRLRLALGRHHRLAPAQMVDAVIADMVGTHGSDDIAVLAVRIDSPTEPDNSNAPLVRAAVTATG